VYAAAGKKEKAYLYFEKSKYDGHVEGFNYLAFLLDVGTVEEYVKVSSNIADLYPHDFDILIMAFTMHLYCGKFDEALTYLSKAISMKPEGGTKLMNRSNTSLDSDLVKFKKCTDMSDAKFELVTSSMAKVMRENKAVMSDFSFHCITEETLNAYVIEISNLSLDEISSMNYDLAFALAEHDELLGIDFAAWFKSNSSTDTDVKDVMELKNANS